MVIEIPYSVSREIVSAAADFVLSQSNYRMVINEPTGNFFYDEWKIKSEYNNTPFYDILKSIDFPIGEARVIPLEAGTCYIRHCDIDDRLHLNLFGECGYLLDCDDLKMYEIRNNGQWYDMDTGKRHSAVAIGETVRLQLVVRKLLQKNNLQDPINVTIIGGGDNIRFNFDNTISPWLNKKNKLGVLSDFSADLKKGKVRFKLEKQEIPELDEILPVHFQKINSIEDI
jgi:hypothetical protein